MKSREQLFSYQRDLLIPKLVESRQVAAFVRMGFGKTISTLTALVDQGMPRTLVVAPSRVARRVWSDEAREWEHTKDLKINVLAGCTPAERIIRLAHKSDIDVINYELFAKLCDTVDLDERYGAIVFDELSRMKTPGATWFKRMRTRTSAIPIRYGLTGTPVGNHYVDLWGEMFAVAGEKPLGPSKALYCARYFTGIDVNEHAKMWVLNYGCADLINERVKPFAFSLDPGDAPPLPPVQVNPIYVPLPAHVKKLADELARELRVELASGRELVALLAGTRASKVRQMAGGAVYHEDGTWERVHDEKLDALEEVVEEQQGRPLIVFYWFRHELERLRARFPQARTLDDSGGEDAWNRGEVEVLLMQPASAAHGLNLQFGGSDAVWYSLPWWELFTQGNGRLARPGQKSKTVMAHVLVAGEVDVAILQHLREQEAAEKKLIEFTRIG